MAGEQPPSGRRTPEWVGTEPAGGGKSFAEVAAAGVLDGHADLTGGNGGAAGNGVVRSAKSGASDENVRPGIVGSENGAHGQKTTNVNGSGDAINGGHRAAILRIVDTHPESERTVDSMASPDIPSRPQLGRAESRAEFEAAVRDLGTMEQDLNLTSRQGLDDTPRSPGRSIKPKKKSSTSDVKSTEKSDRSSLHNGDKHTGHAKNEADTELFERSGGNGEKLTTVKPDASYEEQLGQDRKEAPQDTSVGRQTDGGLVSGREPLKSWQRSGIRFAPWNIPLQRRLQTAVVLWHTLCIAITVSTFFLLCAVPIFWPLLIPYLIYCMTSTASTSGSISHRSEFLRSSPIWSLFASYYPARLHRSVPLAPTRKYIFGYHPHGIISHGAFAAFGTEALGFKQLFPGITNSLLTLDSNFRIPLYRDYALAMGLASVSRESCENMLTHGGQNGAGMGRAITIVVGGARESLDAAPGTMRLVIKRRYGFIKIAMRTGADLVPVMAFGENDLYDQFLPDEHPKIHRVQLLVKKFVGFTIPLFHARGVFNYDVGLMPYRRPLNVVVGRPIAVERVREGKISQEVLERLHGEYMAEVKRLWECWKDEFARDRREEMAFAE